ncbi:MAG: hypothetical protein ABW000_15510 [Actinoplanes sp.]
MTSQSTQTRATQTRATGQATLTPATGQATLTPVTGQAVLTAWERGLRADPLGRAVILLAAVTGLSDTEAEAVELGTRDALLAAELIRLAGGAAWAWTRCTACGEVLDVPVGRELLPRVPVPPLASVTVAGMTFRLPATRDLRSLPAPGRTGLLDRLRVSSDGEITEELADAVEAAMEQAAPGAAVQVDVTCPECGAETTAALDVPGLLWAHVSAAAAVLLSEIHTLSSAYGWTEGEVLALSTTRRRAYLELVHS